jgi:hypothetical protein
MNPPGRLFRIVAEACCIAISLCLLVEFLLFRIVMYGFASDTGPTKTGQIALLLGFVASLMASAWWVFRRVQSICPRAKAKSISAAFLLFTPFAVVVALIIAQIPAGYAGDIAPALGLIVAFICAVFITTVLNFGLAVAILRRRPLVDEA